MKKLLHIQTVILVVAAEIDSGPTPPFPEFMARAVRDLIARGLLAVSHDGDTRSWTRSTAYRRSL
jgi:hypothetical protein